MPEDPIITSQQPETPPAKVVPATPPAAQPGAQAQGGHQEPHAPAKRVRISGGDDDVPDDAEVLELTPSHFKSRLTRAKNSVYKEHGLTAEQFKADLEELKTRRAKEEEDKLAEMGEKERHAAELKKERQLRVDAEVRASNVQDERDIQKEEGRIGRLAEKYIDTDPDTLEVVFRKFSRHLKKDFSDAELAKLDDKYIGKWFKAYAEEHPKHAKQAEGGPEPKKVPLNNGKPQNERPDPAGSNQTTKTARPNQQNSMTGREVKDAAAKDGLNW
jgi:hypothetical protein